jgi:exopolysaccharide production protein ExoZ
MSHNGQPPEIVMKIHSLQALRAVAASLVVADHALLDVTRGDVENSATSLAWMMGRIGVAIFFVISGFIMVHISWDDFGRRGAAAEFLRRRVVRIVPLYWLATIAAFGFHKVSETHGADAGWPELLRSILFIPYSNDDGGWAPILAQGWTLNYEMFFYALFAAALSFRRQIAVPAIVGTLVIFTFAGSFLTPGILAYLSSPIVLLFVVGIGLAVLWRSYGLVEPKWFERLAKTFEPFGEASYSTYLVHGLALTVLLRIWVMAAGATSIWFVPVGFAVATVAGLTVHAALEKPLLRMANSLQAHRYAST